MRPGADHSLGRGVMPRAPTLMPGGIIMFILDCAGLFNDVFSAVFQLDFFQFLVAFLVFEVLLGLFLLLYHGTRKM